MRTLSRAVALIAVLLTACQVTPPGAAIDSEPVPDGTRREELLLVVQVCRPDKIVKFEKIKVDLRGYPKAQTLIQARLSNHADISMFNGWNDAALAAEPDPDDVVIRRLISKSPEEAKGVTAVNIRDFDISIYYPKGSYGSGGLAAYLWDSTAADQPVYEGTDGSPNKTVALGVHNLISERPLKYTVHWFQTPPAATIPIGKFSAWQAPIALETEASQIDAVSWDRTRDRSIKLDGVDADSPRMRFMLSTLENYENKKRFWTRVHPWLVRNYYQTGGQITEFVPASITSIAPC